MIADTSLDDCCGAIYVDDVSPNSNTALFEQVLSDLQENPAAAQKHMQNPMIMNKIQKLISSGIVQMK